MGDDYNNGINDWFHGINKHKSYFKKNWSHREILYCGQTALSLKDDNKPPNMKFRRWNHWKGSLIISNDLIYFKSSFLSPIFFYNIFMATFFTFMLPFAILTIGWALDYHQEIFILSSCFSFIILSLIFMSLIIRTYGRKEVIYFYSDKNKPELYKRKIIFDEYTFIKFNDGKQYYHLLILEKLPNNIYNMLL